jgi:hypothetical protein
MARYEHLDWPNFGLNEKTSQKFIKIYFAITKSLYDSMNQCL